MYEEQKKIKVSEKPEIVVRGTIERPYFEIKYREIGKSEYNLGYGSYFLDNVFKWKEEEFEVVEEKHEEDTNVVQFPVDMNNMQKNILIELLNTRKECINENILTAHGFVSMVDALFYLVKERPIIPTFCAGDLEDSEKKRNK